MEAKLKNQGEVAIITIQGPLEIEKTQGFREICLRHFVGKKIIFNMQKASFVGSTGLQAFLETVRTLSEENQHGLKVVGVQAEFKRIFQNLEIQRLQMHDSMDGAMSSFAFEDHSTSSSTQG
jgi:anti-anti-sigma factor